MRLTRPALLLNGSLRAASPGQSSSNRQCCSCRNGSKGDRHAYASRTRFIPDRLLGLFERTTWPIAVADRNAIFEPQSPNRCWSPHARDVAILDQHVDIQRTSITIVRTAVVAINSISVTATAIIFLLIERRITQWTSCSWTR
jgi:hypothetical protein